MINRELHYQPKGSMCAVCRNASSDCSKLVFSDMPKISKGDVDGTVLVKCTQFKISKEVNDAQK